LSVSKQVLLRMNH